MSINQSDPSIETRVSISFRLPSLISSQIQGVKEKTGVYYPGYEDSRPHITIYSCRFNEELYPTLLKNLKEIKLEPFKVKLSDLRFLLQPHNNKIFVHFTYEELSDLKALHEKVLAVTNPLRGNLIRHVDTERFNNGYFSKEQFAIIQKYGYQYVKENYFPHTTIGEIGPEDSELKNSLKESLGGLEGQEFTIDRISVKFSRKTVPENKKIFESETTDLLFNP